MDMVALLRNIKSKNGQCFALKVFWMDMTGMGDKDRYPGTAKTTHARLVF